MAPPKKNVAVSRPSRALAGLVGLIIVMLVAIVGANAFSPGKWHHDFRVQLGLDLSSGTQVELKALTLKGKAPPAQYMKEAISVMIARVDGAGFSGAQIQQQGSANILVTVPGASANKVVNLVGATAQLYFRQVLLEGAATATTTSSTTPTPTSTTTPSPGASTTPKAGSTPTTGASTKAQVKGAPQRGGPQEARLLAVAKPAASPSPSNTPTSSSSPSSSPLPLPTPSTPPVSQVSGDVTKVNPAVLKLFNQANCNDINGWKKKIHYTTTQYDDPNKQIVSCSVASQAQGITSNLKYVLAPAKVFGSEVTSAQAGVANQQQSLSGQWQVNLSLNGKGAAAFGALTEQMNSQYGNNGNPTSPLDQLAVVLDGVVVSAPQIDQGAIPGGNAQITYFPQSQATQLAQELNYGELKVNLIKQDVSSVTPQLGHNQLVAGLIAAAIGLGLVVVYSFLYYRGLGLVSVSSLIIASILAYGSVVLLSKYSASGFSLSLAGIAGLIVAIGITADSFVVFFERLRDEVRDGRSLKPAVESGWKRARRTILVSDTVSFLCALLLWYFSVSDVKGFAFTLGLTTLIDIIVVFLFTKPMVTLLARTRFFSSGHPMSGLDPNRLGARAPWRSGMPRTSTTRVRGA